MRKFTLLIALLFITIGAMAQTEVSAIENLSNQKVYKLESSRGLMIYNPNNSTVLASTSFYSTFDTTTDNAKWAIYKSGTTGNYYFYNIGAQEFLGNNSNEAGQFPWVTVPTNDVKVVSSTKSGYPFVFSTDNYGAVNHFHPTNNKNAPGIANWRGNANSGGLRSLNDDGSAHKIIEVEDIDTDVLARITELVNFYENPETGNELSYTVTDNAGNTYTGTYVGLQGVTQPSFTGANGYTLTNEVWDDTNYTATINFTYPMSKVGGATNEILLSAWNENLTNGKFIRAVGTDIKVQTIGVAPIDANCLWAIYPSYDNGAFTFAIMNVATGKYINSQAANNTSYVGNDNKDNHVQGIVSLKDAPSMFVIADNGNDFRFSDKANLYLSINSSGNTNVWLGVHYSVHGGTNIYDLALPYYEVAITDAKYATFYAPVAVEIPTGVIAHTVTINGEWATLSEPLEVIPAYTGVVLYAETARTYTFNVTTTDVTVENNALKGTVAATNVTADAYVLGYINVAEEGEEEKKEVGFYTATKNQADNAAFLNNHHKAYLPKTAGMNAASYSFRFGEGTTGISEVKGESGNVKTIYDITGRRVENISAPGIYIIGGRKVLVK